MKVQEIYRGHFWGQRRVFITYIAWGGQKRITGFDRFWRWSWGIRRGRMCPNNQESHKTTEKLADRASLACGGGGLWSLVLWCPLSCSVQRSSRWARCGPDWWTGTTASCGGGTRGPPWWDLPVRWLRSSPGRPSRRGFWPEGGWCRSHTWSSAQNGAGRREKNGCANLDALLRHFKAQRAHLRTIWC